MKHQGTLFELAPVGVALTTLEGAALALNPLLCAMLGLNKSDARSVSLLDFFVNPAEGQQLLARLPGSGKIEGARAWLQAKGGRALLVCMNLQVIERNGANALVWMAIQDITRQHELEQQLNVVASLSRLFSASASLQEYLEAVVKLLQKWCACQCAGVRLLDKEGRLGYAAQRGFSRQFLKRENAVCIKPGGCACVRGLAGKRKFPAVSDNSALGFFVCNHTSRYVQEIGPARGERKKIACIEAQYESLAHIPIRCHRQLLGAIHLADHRPSKFTLGTIALVESMAPLLGEAIRRFTAEQSLQESQARFRSMFECPNTVMLLIDPKTGALVDANPAAAAFYGYSQERLRTMNLEHLALLSSDILKAQSRRIAQAQCLVFPHRLATGEIRTVEVHSSPIKHQGRRLVFSIIHDVAERQLLEKQILHIAEKERERMGQDLHDELGGKLAGVALMGKALAQKLHAAGAWPEAELAEEIVQCVNESITQCRTIAHGLCPIELIQARLHSALLEYAAETERRSGISCKFRVDGDAFIDDPFVGAHLFRIVQEAVANALRHGHAHRIEILLAQSLASLSLEVRDDGIGMPPGQSLLPGMGLRTMKYRAEMIGAQFEVRPAKPTGTRVLCWLPLSPVQKSIPSAAPGPQTNLG